MLMPQCWGYGGRRAPGALWTGALAHLVSSRPTRDPVSKNKVGSREMAQWVKTPAANLDDPGLIPGTHVVRGEDHLPHGVL